MVTTMYHFPFPTALHHPRERPSTGESSKALPVRASGFPTAGAGGLLFKANVSSQRARQVHVVDLRRNESIDCGVAYKGMVSPVVGSGNDGVAL